jgi:hypothetical protein
LSAGSRGDPQGVDIEGKKVHLLPVAPTAEEVDQLETRRDRLLRGMQDGARRVFEIFGPAVLGDRERGTDGTHEHGGQGMGLTAQEIETLVQSLFPDEMLNRQVSLEDIERTIAFTEGLDNQL